MKKISIIILLMIGLFLILLTGCGITPEIDIGNSEYQIDTSDTGTIDTGGTVVTEGVGTVEADVTKPVITGSRDPLPNSLGWNNTDVIMSFSCVDTGAVQSGIDINTVAGMTLSTEGKDQSVTNTGTCIDAAGNVADPVTVSGINIDKTSPVVIITLPKNGKYNLNESITATWSATDDLSGVKDSKAPKKIKLDTKSKGWKKFTLPPGLVEDEAGNTSEEVTISYEVVDEDNTNEDTTKPVITGSRDPLPNSLGWNNTDVTVSFSCEDVGPIQSGIETNTVAGKTVTTEGKDQSVTNTGECIDAAGNVADPVTVSNINIDKTPPVVTIALPKNGKYKLNESVIATWSATDDLSGVVSPTSGSVSIDTSSVGTKTFTLPAGTATDKAGNSSLIVMKSYSVIEDTEEPAEDPGTENPQKWSGLTGFTEWYDSVSTYGDTWLANGFTEWRDLRYYTETAQVTASKAAVATANAKGIKVIWGVAAPYPITSTNWSDFRAAILAAAQWAQDNGVYEFQIGNEEEYHNDDDTMTDAQLITNLKSVATDVQAIFTNGNVSYSCGNSNIGDWVTAGKGDLDILASNVYMTWGAGHPEDWEDMIDDLVGAFGTDGTYLTEFSLNTDSLDSYSTDEAVQAAAVTEMIEYIKASGMERALFYSWHDYSGGLFGVVKDDGTYRLLWSQALLNSESIKFATVPIKTTTVSLPNTIALLPK